MNETNLETLQEQIHDLQSRVLYQEDLLQSLNDVVVNQDKMIAQLHQQLQHYQQQIDEWSHQSTPIKTSEKPPHY